MPQKEIDLDDFAIRVERLCDFLIDRFPFMDGSNDITVIQKLKEDAADLQSMNKTNVNLEGLHTYMRGG